MSTRLWPRAWSLYLAALAGGFAVLEFEAYRHHRMPTLSRELHRWLGCARNRYAGPMLLGAFGAALAAHIALIEAEAE